MMKLTMYLAVGLMLAVGVAGCGAMTEETKRGSFDDASINKAVEASLAAQQGQTFTGVGVQTSSGTVFLTGTVADTTARQRAGELAAGVAGVRNVINNLTMTGADAPAGMGAADRDLRAS